mmetsp:Transcript_30563/g.46894  ORF Transcript_30563/g.46894 Transcript_30563/m.46894 type:complete len:85 (-) Transcript_30563:51-305(-)
MDFAFFNGFASNNDPSSDFRFGESHPPPCPPPIPQDTMDLRRDSSTDVILCMCDFKRSQKCFVLCVDIMHRMLFVSIGFRLQIT